MHIALCVLSLALALFCLEQYNALYELSNHPTTVINEQLCFNAELIKSYYAKMTELGTIDFYFKAQLVDYGYMLSMFAFAFFAPALILRFRPESQLSNRLYLITTYFLLLGVVFDVLENLTSFLMLAFAVDFPAWLALFYSTLAALKFLFIGLGLIVLLLIVCLRAIAFCFR